ncbi:Hypoxanthine-guanine phosphoribosyltransferase [Methylophaga frappieri]|uniref:Hypoxanthine-guanine phosphoribosyltransferase n=1 Tax=Methylophaga frappieri (strain ATCC BAA-2434 / DSM 25690 / JAM7) TaxID=754477 RepID=I1YFW5_METFJ|nr:hypoxanthine-guanine phosphoribosyltransferase [Methylophaga frappieri]AFJ01808.1 Hypoxanthine-guanine phosphoribosyltransferase [Methylophaga frappieri]
MSTHASLPIGATCLYTLEEIQSKLVTLAAQVNRDYQDKNLILLCVMNGAVVTLGQILPHLQIACEIDYVHVSRYGDALQGGELNWLARPQTALQGRHVLLIEDIYDEGYTLTALRQFCEQSGADSVRCLALTNKQHQRKQGATPEYLGLEVPDSYVFGFGMDIRGYWRNAPGIFMIPETAT